MQNSDSFSGHEQRGGRADFGFTPTNKAEKANPMYIGDEFSPSNHRNQHQNDDELDFQGGGDGSEQVRVLKDKQRKLNKALAKQEEDHKQQLLQIETVSMMTKYQLVFIKMETNLVRVVNIIKAKDNFNLLVAFKAILAARNAKVLQVKYKANLVYTSFRARVTTLVRAMNRVKKMLLMKAFNKLSLPFKVAKKVGENQKYLARQLEELQEKMRKRENDTQAASRKLEELNGHILAAKTREMELVNKIKTKERAIAQLENELAVQYQSSKQGKKGGFSGGQHGEMDGNGANMAEVKILEQQIRELEAENGDLRDKLSSTENNVGTFIKEMSDLLDSHELSTNACSEDNNNSLNNSQNAPPHGHHGHNAGHNHHGAHAHHGDEDDLMEMVPKGGKHGKVSKNHPNYQQNMQKQQQIQQGKPATAAYNPMKSNRNYQIN